MSAPHNTLFAELVIRYRTDSGFSQEDIAFLTDDVAEIVEQDYPQFSMLEGLSREAINGYESPKRGPVPRPRSIALLAYALSAALLSAGYEETDPHELFKRLSHAATPHDISAQGIISEEAAITDMLISRFPKVERIPKWRAIMAMLITEYEERIKEQDRRDVNYPPHIDE